MKKKSVVLITTVMLVALLIAGGTVAWFTAETRVEANKFKAGTLKIDLYDNFNFCKAQNVNPGDCYNKQVWIKNLGTKRAFVRIKKDMAFAGMPDSALGVVEYDLGKYWKEHNGYFYYTKEIPAPTRWTIYRTHDLFKDNEVCFNGPDMGNEYQGKKFQINIKGEAIQVTNGAALEEWGVNPATLGAGVGTNSVYEPLAVEGEAPTAEMIEALDAMEEEEAPATE